MPAEGGAKLSVKASKNLVPGELPTLGSTEGDNGGKPERDIPNGWYTPLRRRAVAQKLNRG